jgi:hypothetical protein
MRDFMCATKLQAGRAERLKKIALIFAATLVVAGCGGPKGVRGGNPAKPGPPQKVHLVWVSNQWKVSLNGGPQVNPAAAKIDLARNTGPTKFEVDIQGSTPASFKDPDGLSVWTGSKSTPQSGINSTQILDPVVNKNGKQLIFWDLNQGDAVTLNYSLHFDTGPSVDPIIDNGGHD